MYPSESPWAWGWIIDVNELMKEHSEELMREVKGATEAAAYRGLEGGARGGGGYFFK